MCFVSLVVLCTRQSLFCSMCFLGDLMKHWVAVSVMISSVLWSYTVPPPWWSSSSMQSHFVPLGNKSCSSFSLPELSPAFIFPQFHCDFYLLYTNQFKWWGVYLCIWVCMHMLVGGNGGAEGLGVLWQKTCPYTWINLSSDETLWAGCEGCLQAPDYAAICRVFLVFALPHNWKPKPYLFCFPLIYTAFFLIFLHFCFLASVIPLQPHTYWTVDIIYDLLV